MGVKDFWKVPRSCPSLIRHSVPLRDEARAAVEERGRNAVMVVDLCNTVPQVWGELDYFCGGQFGEFRRRMAAFVDRMRREGVTLVFVQDGATPVDKLETWVRRQEHKMKFSQRIFDSFAFRDDFGSDRIPEPLVLPKLNAMKLLRTLGYRTNDHQQ